MKLHWRNIKPVFRPLPVRVRLFVWLRFISLPWQRIIELSGRPEKVLDFGCGHGLYTALLKHVSPDTHISCCDHDPSKINYFMKTAGNTEGIIFTADPASFVPDYFDMATLHDVLYCMDEREHKELLALLFSKLRPGGMIMVKETVSRPRIKAMLCRLQEFFALRVFRYTKGRHAKILPVHYYEGILKEAGFQLLISERADKYYPWPHYIFLAKKLNKG